jgi:hypothetical protein
MDYEYIITLYPIYIGQLIHIIYVTKEIVNSFEESKALLFPDMNDYK